MATLWVKVVPGSRHNRVAGRYGDAFKVQVSAPPADGKANDAVIELLANALSVSPRQVLILGGHTRPRN